MPFKVHVLGPERALELVRERGIAMEEELARAEVIFAAAPPAAGWSDARSLRLVHAMGVGAEALIPDLPPGVRIAGARGVYAAEVAEHAIGLLLALRRGLPNLVKARTWRPFAYEKLELRTLGLFGCGAIGGRVRHIAEAMGMRVVVHTRHAPNLEAVLRESDALIVTAPRTSATRHAIDARALATMKPHALVIVVSRGGIVDEDALLAALREGRIGGAALDVFEREPLADDSPWWTAPNTIVTPHVAGLARDYLRGVVDRLSDNLQRFERGERLLGEIDREAGY